MHDCEDCDVYLRCGSRGVVEGVRGVRVAPFEEEGVFGPVGGVEDAYYESRINRWNQIDDFEWPSAFGGSRSPNWSVLAEGERVGGDVWGRVLRGCAAAGGGDGGGDDGGGGIDFEDGGGDAEDDGAGNGGVALQLQQQQRRKREEIERLLRAAGVRVEDLRDARGT